MAHTLAEPNTIPPAAVAAAIAAAAIAAAAVAAARRPGVVSVSPLLLSSSHTERKCCHLTCRSNKVDVYSPSSSNNNNSSS